MTTIDLKSIYPDSSNNNTVSGNGILHPLPLNQQLLNVSFTWGTYILGFTTGSDVSTIQELFNGAVAGSPSEYQSPRCLLNIVNGNTKLWIYWHDLGLDVYWGMSASQNILPNTTYNLIVYIPSSLVPSQYTMSLNGVPGGFDPTIGGSSTGPNSFTPSNLNKPYNQGTYPGLNHDFTGTINYFDIFNRALATSEINYLNGG
jgi:hypothetical protein